MRDWYGPRESARLFLAGAFFVTNLLATGAAPAGANSLERAREQESAGDLSAARSLLEQDAKQDDPAAQLALAQFLERHHAPERRDAYLRLASLQSNEQDKLSTLRQVLIDDALDGDDKSLAADLERYRAAGGQDLALPARRKEANNLYTIVAIPGPLSSFARMAALSPDLSPEDLLPALARNVVVNGYQAVSANESLEQTEYLKLLIRYVSQARELEQLAGSAHKLVVPECDSDQTANLLRVLGYRMRGSCGSDLALETVNATRAFLTVDSAFPLAQLESDLRANRHFEYAFAPTQVPLLYNSAYWLNAVGRDRGSDFLDGFLSDPSLCRLYLGLSKLDRPTADAMRRKVPAARLRLYAHVLDFYGSMFQVRNGAAVVPGSPKAWAQLTGVSPNDGGAFFERLMATDDGWLASYFDALIRINGPVASYLTEPERIKRFYSALRGKITSPGPARPVFRASTELMLLTTTLSLERSGEPHIPGNIDVWRNLFLKHPHGKYDGKLTRSANNWRNADDVLEALFALCRKTVENEPLRIFLAANDIDRDRTKPLSPGLVSRLAYNYRAYASQYPVFTECRELSESSISAYLDLFSYTSSIRDNLTRADAMGSLQALVGIWQILSRQGSIPSAEQDKSFAAILQPFEGIKNEVEIFEAGRHGVTVLLQAAGSPKNGRAQDRLTDLLVGTPDPNREHAGPAETFARVFDAQRLVPLDSLYSVVDHGERNDKALASLSNQLARFEEVQSLRSSLSAAEKNLLALGYWSERHIDQERRANVEGLLKGSDKKDPRGVLAPFLRDTLVGILYAYYAPPGAQILLTNPLFVRNHDFIGAQSLVEMWRPTEIVGTGWPASAGGRLMGSLSGLPYTLAQAEQNFLTPSREQALIWGDLVPQIIVAVTVPRWRNIQPEQLRWMALQLQRGRDLVALSALNPALSTNVLRSLARYATPARVEHVNDLLEAGNVQAALNQLPPAELYALATDPALSETPACAASRQLAELAGAHHPGLTPAAISTTFGTPKPTLTHSYRPGLINLRTFPTLMGYSSRILAESWESNGLYYAALADELGTPAGQLYDDVPEWTRTTIENIFATHLEDWPALLRSLRTTGEALRQHNSQRAALTSQVNQVQ